jgi:acyl dehydratase
VNPATFLELQGHAFEDLFLGQSETYRRTVSASDVVGFAEISGDRNPIHLSEHFAARTPFKSRIAHGLYTASLISAVLGTRLPGPGAVYLSQTLKFHGPGSHRRCGRCDRRGGRTDPGKEARPALLPLPGRRQSRCLKARRW